MTFTQCNRSCVIYSRQSGVGIEPVTFQLEIEEPNPLVITAKEFGWILIYRLLPEHALVPRILEDATIDVTRNSEYAPLEKSKIAKNRCQTKLSCFCPKIGKIEGFCMFFF